MRLYKQIRALWISSVVIFALGCASSSPVPNEPEFVSEPEIDPDKVASAYLDLGVFHLQSNDYKQAQFDLEKALDAGSSRNAEVYSVLGLLYQRLDKPKEAEDYHKKALQIESDNFNLKNSYAQFLCSQNRYKEAMRYFLQAAKNKLNPTREVPYSNAGVCSLNAFDRVGAEKYFRQALLLNPYMSNALIEMAQISYEQKSYLPARGYLERYREIVVDRTARSLWLAILIEKKLNNRNVVSSSALLLRDRFPDSEETKLLNKSGIH